MPGMNEVADQPRSLGEYIQGNQEQLLLHDSATGLATVLSPSARVNDDAPITEGSQGVASAPDTNEGQGATDAAPGMTPPVVVQPNPEMDALRSRLAEVEAENEQTRQLLIQQAQAAARAEQARFMQSLEGLEPEEKQAKLLQFQNQQLVRANQSLNQRLQETDQRAEQTRQEIAKTQVAHILANRHGLPSQYAQVLLRAQTAEQMQADAAFFAEQFKQKQATEQTQARQQFMEQGAYAPTGDNAGAPVPEGPKKRSGDIQGLINSRSYTVQAINR